MAPPDQSTPLPSAPEPVSPEVGWGVLHLFLHVDAATDADSLRTAVDAARSADHQVVTAALLGHKADLGVMALGPDWRVLRRLQTALVASGAGLAGSFVSLTELSEYALGVPDEMKQARLRPQLPPEGKPAFCFYPMARRRAADANWYSLEFEERQRLMMEHGRTGRTFAGRILQVITASTGIDDWEWGVTLFGEHPDDLKDVVYTMRYDEVSARFAEFGPFWAGICGDLETVLDEVGC